MTQIVYPRSIFLSTPNEVAAKLGDADDATALAAAATAIGLDDKLDLTGGTLTGALQTTGDSSEIYTNGIDARIFTSGSDAYIYTSGSDAEIYTSGSGAHIYTFGANAHIYTYGGGHIQTSSTFKLDDGTHVTTLSHAPSADRAIAFPDAGGTVMLETLSGINASTARTNLSAVGSVTTGVTGADAITNMMSLTQAEYNAITPAANTLYVIV